MLASCKPNKIEFELAPIQLRFSTDTVYFDTLLSTVTSTTKRLRVFNDDAKDCLQELPHRTTPLTSAILQMPLA